MTALRRKCDIPTLRVLNRQGGYEGGAKLREAGESMRAFQLMKAFRLNNFFYAVLCGLGIFTAYNADVYRDDLITIANQTQVTAAEIAHPKHPYDSKGQPVALPSAKQVQETPRPAARGEDFATAQLLPANRRAVDTARFEDDEIAAFLGSGLVVFVKRGLDSRASKRDEERRERQKREREEHERQSRDREERDRVEREQRAREQGDGES